MSRNEWEGGTVDLPTTAVAEVKRALREAANALNDRVSAECLRLWRGPLGETRSSTQYIERLSAAMQAATRGNYAVEDEADAVQEAVYRVMYKIVGKWGEYDRTPPQTPHMPHADDIEAVAPRSTNRTDAWTGGEWSIKIEGHTLSYDVADNNHSCSRARAHPVVAAMFAALERVTWTRSSGGVIWGNDEYNQEERHGPGGGNYITAEFGPQGEAQRAAEMGISLEKYRKFMTSARRPTSRW